MDSLEAALRVCSEGDECPGSREEPLMSGQKEAAEENLALRLPRDGGGTGRVPSGLITEAEEEKGTLGRTFTGI